MPSYKAQTLVLKKTKLGETDAIITMLDSGGAQLCGVAKGARKPGSRLGARLELYSVVEVMMHTGKSLDIVTEVRLINDNTACRSDIEHSAAAAVVIETAEKVTRDSEPEPILYNMSLEALRTIGASQGYAKEVIACTYVLKVCSVIGYRPTTEEMISANFTANDLIDTVQRLLAKRFVDILECDTPDYQKIAKQLINFTDRWTKSYVGINLKSLNFIANG
jgi:DNA repair protein RecO (recombination protein O)